MASNLTSSKVSGNATTLVFASALAHNNATVVYTFATFANAMVITLGTRHPPPPSSCKGRSPTDRRCGIVAIPQQTTRH
jgi:hypothetical protein